MDISLTQDLVSKETNVSVDVSNLYEVPEETRLAKISEDVELSEYGEAKNAEIPQDVGTKDKNKKSKEIADKTKLSDSMKYTLVYCHLETLRSSLCPTLVHLTQLGCFSYGWKTLTSNSFFLPIVPPGLNKYLDSCKLSGDILQALNMTREDDGRNFLFKRQK